MSETVDAVASSDERGERKAAPAGRSAGGVALISAMVFAALVTVAYWAIWFGGGRDLLASSHAPAYYTFENAFPAADGWLALTLLLGALGLWLRRPWGLFWGLLAGGAGIYLGCMDVLFDLENGIYLVPKGGDPSAVVVEIIINIFTFTLGVIALTYFWRQRDSLLNASR